MPNLVKFGPFELDLDSADLRKNGRSIRLPEQQFQILHLLILGKGEVVTREDIRKRLWPNDTVVEFDRSINAAIMKLRAALGDSATKPRFLETVASRGYRLLIEVHEEPASEPLRIVPRAKEGSRTGQKILHYRVLQVLGGGGMGLVYRGEDLRLNRAVALKFLPEELALDPTARLRFEREARTASSLNHPNICTIYQVEEDAEHPFIVMELLEGLTLRDRIKEHSTTVGNDRGLPLRELLDIAIQIAEGLNAAHSKNIIHRDIKPANIFLSQKQIVKILDFGLAKVSTFGAEASPPTSDNTGFRNASADVTLSQTGSMMGTAQYMSPEQVLGQKLDARSDLFSFGTVLFELATGQPAFRGETTEIIQNAILHHHPLLAGELNPELPAALSDLIYKSLEKNPDQRVSSASEMRDCLEKIRTDLHTHQLRPTDAPSTRDTTKHLPVSSWVFSSAVILLAALGILWAVLGRTSWRHPLTPFTITPRDIVVVADFENSTGDKIFDGALRQALIVGIEQSPTIRVLSDLKTQAVLGQMGHSGEERVSGKLARELCQRVNGKILIRGSVAPLGSTYVLGLEALRCGSGETIAHEQLSAPEKDGIVRAVGQATYQLRARLGESSGSLEKFNAPLEQATTSSLEALKAYSIGVSTAASQGDAAAIPLFKRAIELDPNFAMAYGSIAEIFSNRNEPELASTYATKAFALKDRLTEYERLSIESWYYAYVMGDGERSVATLEVANNSYPDTPRVLNDLGAFSGNLGNLDRARELFSQALSLEPTATLTRVNLAIELLGQNKVDEAGSILSDAGRQDSTAEYLLEVEYWRAFLLGDTEAMRESVLQSQAFPSTYPILLFQESNTKSFYGGYQEARHLTVTAANLLEGAGFKESAANCWSVAAVREAEVGNGRQSRDDLEKAFRLAHNNDVSILAALATAEIGDLSLVEPRLEKLAKDNPSNTLIQKYWVPVIRAQVELRRHKPDVAIDLLNIAKPYDLATPDALTVATLYPAYVRGQAYLALGDGRQAESEFQKMIDHRGLVLNYPLASLAFLGKARAEMLIGDQAKASENYQKFFHLWQGADQDIPLLTAARAEFAKQNFQTVSK